MIHENRPATPEEAAVHYGVLGMHWGVTRDPTDKLTRPEKKAAKANMKKTYADVIPIRIDQWLKPGMSDEKYASLSTKKVTLKKGQEFARVTARKNERLRDMTYVSYHPEDKNLYRAVMPVTNKVVFRGRTNYEFTYQATQALKGPSEKERVDAFTSLMDTPSIKVLGRKKPITGRQYLKNSGYRRDVKRLDSQQLGQRFYEDQISNLGKTPIKSAYFKSLESKGYNMLADDNDRNILSKEPIILLNPNLTVKYMSVHQLTKREVNQAQQTFTSESTKQRLASETVKHYGVLGMHWGVYKHETISERRHRNASQKPFRSNQIKGELKTRLGQSLDRKGMTKAQYDRLGTKDSTINAGKTLRRITRNPTADAAGGNLFVSRTMKDAQIYRGVMPSSKFLGSYRRPSEGYSEVTMKVVTKLTSPSEKERVDAFIRLMDEPSIKLANGMSISGRDWLKSQGYERQAKKLDAFELGTRHYQNFTKDNGVKNSPINSAYFKALQEKGYNAIVDDNDRNITSNEPWLVIDSKGSLQNLRVKALSTDDILKAQKNLRFPDKSSR